jgi:hypothetical protein
MTWQLDPVIKAGKFQVTSRVPYKLMRGMARWLLPHYVASRLPDVT